MKKLLLLLFLLMPVLVGFHVNKEKYYQHLNCPAWHGVEEIVLSDGSRVDCVTEEYVFEFEFAGKFHEAIGQSLHYSMLTGKIPAIALIIENESDRKYLEQLKAVIRRFVLPIKIFIIEK